MRFIPLNNNVHLFAGNIHGERYGFFVANGTDKVVHFERGVNVFKPFSVDVGNEITITAVRFCGAFANTLSYNAF